MVRISWILDTESDGIGRLDNAPKTSCHVSRYGDSHIEVIQVMSSSIGVSK